MNTITWAALATQLMNDGMLQMVLWHAIGTTAGQDLNLSLDRVLGNRNLTNKLWNAGKFLQMQTASCSAAELQDLAAVDFSSADSLADLPLVERWILSALHQACKSPNFIKLKTSLNRKLYPHACMS